MNASGTAVTGTGEIGATVQVRAVADGPVIGTATVQGDGTYSAPLSPPQTDGQVLIVTQTDAALNVSPEATATAPELAPPAPTAALNGAGTEVTGTGEAGSTIEVRNAANALLGTTTVLGDGTYTATLNAPQVDGEQLSVTQSDPGGTSPPASVTALDQFAPAAPTATINGTGTVVSGTGEAGATIEVRNAGGVIGTGSVAPDGTYSVPLDTPQTAGQALTVTQADAGGTSPSVPVTAPFDIDAFANVDTAGVTIAPLTTPVTPQSASYGLLLSVASQVGLQVLGTPSVGFTVPEGETRNATFVYDALLNITALGPTVVVVQRLEGGQWVSVTGAGPSTLLGLSIGGDGNASGSITLPEGQYRAFVALNGIGVGVLGTLTTGGTQTDPDHATAVAATGNVITDPGPGGEVDIVNPGTVVDSVTFNGVEYDVNGATNVTGAHGTLVINPNGSYTYTPTADAASIGTSDVFEYTLRSPSNEFESANLTINIQSGAPAVQALAFSAAGEEDVVSLAAFAGGEGQPAPGNEPTGDPAYDLFEGQGDLETVLQGYLDTMISSEPDTGDGAGLAEQAAASDPVAPVEDPLAYLAVVSHDPNDDLSSSHMV